MFYSKKVSVGKALANKPGLALSFLILLALAIRLWFIDQPLQGDEYHSLREATTFGSKLNGWLYYVILFLWMQVSDADWWYRFLSVGIGVAAIPAVYWMGRLAVNSHIGLIAAALVAVSPFHSELSLYVRHYSLFLTASTLAITATFFFLSSTRFWLRYWFLAGSLLLLVVSHVFGVVLCLALLSFIYIWAGKWPASFIKRLTVLLVPLLVIIGIISVPASRCYGWEWLQRAINAGTMDCQAARGISLVQFVKIGITLYVFFTGYNVYPLTWWVVIPATVVSVTAGSLGIVKLWRRPALMLVIFVFSLLPVVFLGLDALVPAFTETASPRHLAMVWPAFVLLLAAGAGQLRRGFLTGLLLLACVIGLGFNKFGDWSYGLSGPDWRNAAAEAQNKSIGAASILYDGRMADPMVRYYPSTITRVDSYSVGREKPFSTLNRNDTLIFAANDFKPENRQVLSRVMHRLQDDFVSIDGTVDYPFFQYILHHRSLNDVGLETEAGQIPQPLDIYGLEFQDLNLPLTLDVEETQLKIIGGFSLPSSDGHEARKIPANGLFPANGLIVVSNVIESEDPDSKKIAEIIVMDERGHAEVFPMRMGQETQHWDQICSPATPCRTTYRWHKRVALVGQYAYADAWRDFWAGLHAVHLKFKESTKVAEIQVRYSGKTGHLYIWGLAMTDTVR